ncbi:hypothetical protein D3C75_1270510 [compost metagenome]
MFDKHPQFAFFFQTIGQEAGSPTGTAAAINVVTHHANGDVHFGFILCLRGGDGVQARRQRAQQAE